MKQNNEYLSEDILFGWSKEDLLNLCINSPFPGTLKYEPNHPIWDCYIARSISPKEAWKSKIHLLKAINNLYWIVNKCLKENKYIDFFNNVEKAFSTNNNIEILRAVLTRFTVAKIAPKVTALPESMFLKIIKESNIDISNGIYCPMAGFGGIIRGAERWFKQHDIKPKIEAFDINPYFCKYYGWIQKDLLSDYVETDKVVFVCPPFGEKTERWKGTPDNMYYSFEEWVNLIKEHIKAPQYIFVGPEINTLERAHLSGLFRKRYGIQWYPQYSNK